MFQKVVDIIYDLKINSELPHPAQHSRYRLIVSSGDTKKSSWARQCVCVVGEGGVGEECWGRLHFLGKHLGSAMYKVHITGNLGGERDHVLPPSPPLSLSVNQIIVVKIMILTWKLKLLQTRVVHSPVFKRDVGSFRDRLQWLAEQRWKKINQQKQRLTLIITTVLC